MTVQSGTNRNNYLGNGSASSYPYTFRILRNTHLLVTVRDTNDVETTLSLTTHYTVTGVGSDTGGNVVLVNGAFDWISGGNLKNGYALSIRRVLPLLQETDIRNQGDFFPEVHEDVFDRLVMIDQQQTDELTRAIKLPETLADSFNPNLPGTAAEAANRAGRALIFNAAGDGMDIGPTATDVANAQANAAAAAASAASAIAAAASAQNLWRDVVSVTGTPYNVTNADRGRLLLVTTSGGTVTINLPTIAGLDLTSAFPVTIVKVSTDTNIVNVVRGGTDTIDDNVITSRSFQSVGEGGTFIPDTDFVPDRWTMLPVHPRGLSYNQIATLATQAMPGLTLPLSDTFPLSNQSLLTTERVQLIDAHRLGIATKTATFTATIYEEVLFCNATSGAITANLFTSANNVGRMIRLIKTDTSANAVTIDPAGAELIGGASTLALTRPGESVVILANGTGWDVIQRVVPQFGEQSVVCDSPSGYGSGAANVRRFTNVTVTGTDISYNSGSEATNGMVLTVNTPGRYSMMYVDRNSAAATTFGISRNGAGGTTITALAAANRLCVVDTGGATLRSCAFAVAWLNAGDTIRAHSAGGPNETGATAQFRMERIG